MARPMIARFPHLCEYERSRCSTAAQLAPLLGCFAVLQFTSSKLLRCVVISTTAVAQLLLTLCISRGRSNNTNYCCCTLIRSIAFSIYYGGDYFDNLGCSGGAFDYTPSHLPETRTLAK